MILAAKKHHLSDDTPVEMYALYLDHLRARLLSNYWMVFVEAEENVKWSLCFWLPHPHPYQVQLSKSMALQRGPISRKPLNRDRRIKAGMISKAVSPIAGEGTGRSHLKGLVSQAMPILPPKSQLTPSRIYGSKMAWSGSRGFRREGTQIEAQSWAQPQPLFPSSLPRHTAGHRRILGVCLAPLCQ